VPVPLAVGKTASQKQADVQHLPVSFRFNPFPSGALPPVLGVNSSARWGKPGGASLDALAALCPLPTIQNDEIHHCLEA
jgi:hypothetical protein